MTPPWGQRRCHSPWRLGHLAQRGGTFGNIEGTLHKCLFWETHHRPQRGFKTSFAVSFRSPGMQQKEDSRDKFQLLLVPEMYKYFNISMTKR